MTGRLSTNQAFVKSFRCPEELCAFTVAPRLSSKPGYFRFGEDIICYGRCLGPPAQDPSGLLYDAMEDVRIDGSGLVLPFDPNEIIENLRFERYVTATRGRGEKALYDAYYSVRPLLPVWLRRHMQKMRLSGSRQAPFPRWPVDWTVDRILERLLLLTLKAQGEQSIPFIWFWPQGIPSCAIITHDVETTVGLDFCSTLMDIDDSFGMKASFQLVPEKRYPVSDRTLGAFRSRGFEVNVHDLNHDGHLYSDYNEFRRRANKINEYAHTFGASGFRSGALYRNLDWYPSLDFSYDMSVPCVGHLEAQRGGACTIKPYFINDMVELPVTTTQDYSLFHILGDYSIDLWKKQIDTIVHNHGLVSFIIHPDYMLEKKARETYQALLAYLSQLRAEGKLWIALPGEVAEWWRERDQMKLIREGSHWHAAGTGQVRARVAKAYLHESNLHYDIDLPLACLELQERSSQPDTVDAE